MQCYLHSNIVLCKSRLLANAEIFWEGLTENEKPLKRHIVQLNQIWWKQSGQLAPKTLQLSFLYIFHLLPWLISHEIYCCCCAANIPVKNATLRHQLPAIPIVKSNEAQVPIAISEVCHAFWCGPCRKCSTSRSMNLTRPPSQATPSEGSVQQISFCLNESTNDHSAKHFREIRLQWNKSLLFF